MADPPQRLTLGAHLDGDALACAVEAGGTVIMPNEDELAQLVGRTDDVETSAQPLSARTGVPVVVTRGSRGVLVADGDAVLGVAAPHLVGEIGALWRALAGPVHPAMAGIDTTGLWQPEALIEIMGVTVIPDDHMVRPSS